MPTSEEEFPTYNHHRNYAVYLSQPFFFVFLQVLLLLVTIYALGSESKFGTSDEWLQAAQGNIGVAVLGKLLPYTFIFIGMGVLANAVFFGWMQILQPEGMNAF
jgi:ABC-2 type transport system permease protein